MNRTLATSAVLGAAAALVTAGCGGGGGGGDKPLSKAAYAAKADAACAAAQKKGSAIDLSSSEKIAASGDKAKKVLDDLANNIDDLEPPDALKDSAKSFVAGLKKEASDFGEMTQAAKKSDEAKIKAIETTLQSESAATSEDARAVGAAGCARLFA